MYHRETPSLALPSFLMTYTAPIVLNASQDGHLIAHHTSFLSRTEHVNMLEVSIITNYSDGIPS